MSIESLDSDDFWESLLIEYVFGIPYDEYGSNIELLTREVIEKNLEEAVNYLEDIRNDNIILPKGYYIHDKEFVSVGYHILGLLILQTGALLPDRVRDEILRTTAWEYDKRYGWNSHDMKLRQFYLKDFRDQIINYKVGKIPCFRRLDITRDEQFEISSIGLEQLYKNVELKRCYIIKYVNLQCCNLKRVPEELFDFKNIECLNLSFNYLKKIPDEIGCFNKLKKLNLKYNKLNYLPESLAQLSNLKSLNIHKNNIKKIPSSLRKIFDSGILYVGDNPINL